MLKTVVQIGLTLACLPLAFEVAGCNNNGSGSDEDDGRNIQVLTLDYDHGPLEAGTVVDVACISLATQAEHVVGGGCDCLHLHSAAGISIETLSGTTPVVADAAPGECGHGCLTVANEDDSEPNCLGLDVEDSDHPRRGLCVEVPCGEEELDDDE